jgi:CheY-like chemotaxis protein/HPt (histidine-containing phosphotransfer) domain-containing protein
MHGARASQKGLDLTLRVAPEVPDSLVGDAVRLRQILTNLIGNAIKFTDVGSVHVTARLVPLESSPGQPAGAVRLHFCVQDTGIGISEENQRTIFLPFEQADRSITRQYGGTGLGLSICSQLVAQMKGHIWVESEVGRGSRFHFTAEFELGRASGPQQVPEGLSQLLDKRVLIADDSFNNREILCELLQSWGLRTTSVSTAQMALEEIKRAASAGQPYRLALLDATLSNSILAGEIGDELAAEGNLIMMFPSVDCAAQAARYHEAGVVSYVTKPVSRAELLETIIAVTHSPTESDLSRILGTERSRGRRLRVLLAEDNPVNRDLAAALLVRLGHEVEFATDGLAAVEAVERSNFDLVLMDLQMPKLDGIRASQEIRRQEKARVKAGAEMARGLPIVALTAHARREDREACEAAGMNGYITKPIRRQTLQTVLDQLFSPELDSKRSSTARIEAVFDAKKLMREANGDLALIRRLAALYFEQAPTLRETMDSAWRAGQMDQLFSAAHTLEGSLRQFVAVAAAERASRVAEAARGGGADVLPLIAELNTALDQFEPALRGFLATLGPS